MNRNTRKPEKSKKKIPVFRILILAAVLLGSVLLIMIYMAGRFGWFSNMQNHPVNAEITASDQRIPDMAKKYESGMRHIFYENDPENPLADIHELEAYEHTIRIITIYGDNVSSESLTITRQSEKYKVESDSRIIICDGKNLYLDYGTQSLTTEPNENLYHSEIGTTSLEDIRRMLKDTENYRSTYQTSDDYRTIAITITDLVNNIRMELEISLEYGLVTSERFYTGDTAYRTVITEALDTSVQISENYFNIPDESK